MIELTINLLAWGAWSPGLQMLDGISRGDHQRAENLTEDKPSLDFLDNASRRRLTLQSKMIFHAVEQAAGWPPLDELPMIFASRFSENQITTSILREIINNDLISPLNFGLSVHNSPAGTFSISARNHAPSDSISAEEDSFIMALVNAKARLNEKLAGRVMVVMHEEPLDPVYSRYLTEVQTPYALALVLGNSGGQKLNIKIKSKSNRQSDVTKTPAALDFLRWCLSEKTSQAFDGSRYFWTCSK